MTTTATAVQDALNVSIRVGDTVTVLSHGGRVRLADVGRSARVVGLTRRNFLVLADSSDFMSWGDEIAGGHPVNPTYVAVARRDGERGHEGNRTQEA